MKKLLASFRRWRYRRIVKQCRADVAPDLKFLQQLVLFAAERYGTDSIGTFESAYALWCRTINAGNDYLDSAFKSAIGSPKKEA